MATLSLKISLEGGKIVKTVQLEPSTTVFDACRLVRDKILEASQSDPKEYGLFLPSEEDGKKGIWLEPSRTLDYYMLRNGDVLEYARKTRNLRVRMLDGSVKTLLVDDSQIVANLMVVICTKIGITNYEEYGLVREDKCDEPDPCDKPHYGTLTLRRKHQDKERDHKMDQLRKKLRTDDEVNWVEGGRTLREQGIEVSETLLLRRKLFFSDRNVDSRDPVQLNLLYVQARDAILDTTHPVTMDKACEFAGIQCQIQFGDHKEDKHTTGFLDLKEFLPASYVKVKGIEKKIFKEHKKHVGLSELDAKVLYTKTARDLKTYGVAFFLVKEKMKGKNKLVPRLLGVTKDSVLRLDEKTKEILQTWPLTTVRRWCASPNTFTLDFGDYSDQYYSVQTTEAEQILQVIAGYIDIIVRKRRAKDHLGIDGDEGSAMLEDSVSPNKANIIQHDTFKSDKVNTQSVAKPAVLRPGADGAKSVVVGHMVSAQQTTISGQIITGHTPPASGAVQQTRVTAVLSEPQRALLSTIITGKELIRRTQEELTRTSVGEIGADAESQRWRQSTLATNRHTVTSHIAAMNAATAQVVTLTAGPTEEVDHTAVGAAITTITSNLPEVTKGVQIIASLMEEEDGGDKLLDATRKLCSAFTDLLKAAEPDTKEPRQNLLNAASRVGEASTSVLTTIGEEHEFDKETQDILLSLAKGVANTTAALVLKAKNVAAQCRDEPAVQAAIIAAATNTALATSQLVATTKVVAPTIHSPECRSQLVNAARQVAAAVDRLVGACEPLRSSPAAAPHVVSLVDAARQVTDQLERLLAHSQLENGTHARAERTVETVVSASERVAGAGDAAEMVRHARALGSATATLITTIKTEAERADGEQQRRLLAAAKLLADATARMVEAARQCATQPQDRERQEALRRAAEELRYITVDYAQGQDIVSSQLARLQETARAAASSATQLVTSSQHAAQYSSSKHVQETLVEETRALYEHVPRVQDAIAYAAQQEHNPAAQIDLISASETFLQSSGHAISAARSALPTVNDVTAAKRLADTTHQFTTACADLRSAVSRARVSCKGLELDAAAETVRSLQRQLHEVDASDLRPLPSQTAEWAAHTLSVSSRSAAGATAALVSGTRAGEAAECGRAAGDLAASLRQYTAGVRAAAALQPDTATTQRVISSGQSTLETSLTLVETVKTYLTTTERVDTASIVTIARDLSQNLERTMEAIPSHAELDEALANVTETLTIIEEDRFPASSAPYRELQSSLESAAAELNAACCDVVETVDSAPELGRSSQRFGDAFNRLLSTSMEMCSQTEETESRTSMVSSMKSVTVTSSKLLSTAKSVSQDLNRPNAKNQLAAAARAVTDSINRLVDVCTQAAPGQKECAAALRSMEGARVLLDRPTQPLSDLNYFSTLDAVVDQSKLLSEGMSGMAASVKRSQHEEFARAVGAVATAVTGLVECAAQAAYLVAASDESSVPGRPGLVDQGAFARAQLAIDQACATLADTSTNQQQVLSAATVIARHTSALCNACRVASSRTTEPAAKRHFVQAAKDVANSTAALVKEIKALDTDYSQENRACCAAATGPLRDAVRSLCAFADRSEFASVPAKISPQAARQQDAILDCGRSIISGSCSMVEAAQQLALSPADRAQWQELAAHSKTVSDSIKSLVTNIREKAPGQRECGVALDTLAGQLRTLDSASIQIVAQELAPRTANTLQGYCEQTENSTSEMLELVEGVHNAACGAAERLGHAVVTLVSYAEPLTAGAVGAASSLTDSGTQTELLQHARTVLETLAALVRASMDSGGNPRATGAHGEVSAAAVDARAALSELSACVRHVATARGETGPLLDSLARSLARLTENRMSLVGGSWDETDGFSEYQSRMAASAKEISRIATDMTACAATDAGRLVTLGDELVARYDVLAQDSLGAAATTPNHDIAQRIRACVVELGECCGELVKSGGQCRLSAMPANQRLVANAAKQVNEKVVAVLGALQAGARGTQACIDAAATIAAIISDLDTTILFASAGTLHSEKENDTFSDHRENILKTAKELVEDTKTLVGGAAGTQDQLAGAARSAVNTIVRLCEVVKGGAMSLGGQNPEPQVLLLHAARDVAAALRDLAAATTAAAGKHHQHPDMQRLKHAAKTMVTNVTSLLKTVKAVEDEHTRGTRALEATIEAISQEIELLESSSGGTEVTATAEELVRCTRGMTGATARAVAAGNTSDQEQLTAAANLGRKTVVDMLHAAKGAARGAESAELGARTLSAGQKAAEAYRALLSAVLAASSGDSAARQRFPDLSRHVAASVQDILHCAELLKGSDWVDPDDPTVIAESELLGAAASIDAAARKLDALRPRMPPNAVQETDENLNFDEMILEAAKSIIAATSALVRAASAAQRELIDQGAVARRPLSSSDDGQWSEGLVSAARLVAAAAHALVEAANALVQGAGSEERLISAARQVASSTAQLLVACKVKADPMSETTRRLQAAGAEVIRSTDNLVRAARDSISCEEERSLVLNRRMVGGIAQEIDARSEVLRIEKELEEARGRLSAIRQAKYRLRGDTSGDETDDNLTINRFTKTPTSSFVNTTYSPNSTLHTTRGAYDSTLDQTGLSALPKSPGYASNPSFAQNQSSFGQGYTVHSPSFSAKSPGYTAQSPGYTAQSPGYTAQSPGYTAHSPGYTAQSPGYSAQSTGYTGQSQGYTTQSQSCNTQNENYTQSTNYAQSPGQTAQGGNAQNGYSSSYRQEIHTSSTGPSFSSFRPEQPKQNYEGFTTRYETRLYDTPKPTQYRTIEEQRQFETSQLLSKQEKFASSPLSPKFNARELKPEEPKTRSGLDGLGERFTEHQRATEAIPGGTRHTEVTVKRECYRSPVETEIIKKDEVRAPFVTSTPFKSERNEFSQSSERKEIVRPAPPPPPVSIDRIGKGDFLEETSTEVKEIPNGTQKITTTKIYSSSPVSMKTTETRDDVDSCFSTLDSRRSDASRGFMRPSEFSGELAKTLEGNISKRTVTSETIERKSVMTSSHKSETSSTVTKKFGNA